MTIFSRTSRERFERRYAWHILISSGLMEAVWATMLGGGLTLAQFPLFLGCLVISVGGLAKAMGHIPTSTAYAAWTGIGAGATVIWAMATGAESADPRRIALIIGLIGCVIGLRALSPREDEAPAESAA